MLFNHTKVFGGTLKKLLLPCLFLIGCASYHDPNSSKPFVLEKGVTTYQDVARAKGSKGKCLNIQANKYCQWKNQTNVFQDDLYLKSLTHIEKPLNYEVAVKTLKLEGPGKMISYGPAGSKINPDSIEWRRFNPLFQGMLKASGRQLTSKPVEADQIVRINFGVEDTASSEKAKRFLELTAFDKVKMLKEKKNVELWKVEVSSVGGNRDLKKVLPILAAVSQYYVTFPSEVNETMLVSENELVILAFKDYLVSGKK